MLEVNMPHIIGLCGDIGCGKSTVAKFLQAEYGYESAAFATKLKDVARQVFGLESRHVYGTQADKAEELEHVTDAAGNRRTPRYILEWLGTEGFRTIDPDVWVKYAVRLLTPGHHYVFEDVRFRNEFDAIRQLGGLVWEVVRVGGPEQGGRTGHRSDEEWRAVNKDKLVVARHGDMDGLRQSVANTMLECSGA